MQDKDADVAETAEVVETLDHSGIKDADNDKTEEEMSESGETTASTTESDSDVVMESNNEDPFAWDKQVITVL